MSISVGNVKNINRIFTPSNYTDKPSLGDFSFIDTTRKNNVEHAGIFVEETDTYEFK